MNKLTDQIQAEVNKVVLGKEDIVRKVLLAILAQGHVLLEDVPGVGKTTLAKAFSKTLGLDSKRVQFTSDTLPSDIIGFSVFDKADGKLKYQSGAIMTNLLLADEINRTSSKTQSALLEAMEELQVTVDGVTRPLPKPFIVLATENPVGSAGTQMLPASQLDRFMLQLSMGYPNRASTAALLKDRHHVDPLSACQTVTTPAELEKLIAEVSNIHVADRIYDYIAELVDLTRSNAYVTLGVSPRGALAVTRAAKANAYLEGRDYVIPDDVRRVPGCVCPPSDPQLQGAAPGLYSGTDPAKCTYLRSKAGYPGIFQQMKKTILGSALCYLLLLLALAALLLTSGSFWALAGLCLLLLLPLASWAVNIYIRRHLQADILTPTTTAKRTAASCRVRIRNGAFLPVMRYGCQVSIRNDLTEEEQTVTLTGSIGAKGESSQTILLQSSFCGRVYVQISRFTLLDYLGLLPMKAPVKADARLTILPDLYPMEADMTARPAYADDGASNRRGEDRSEVYQLREYRPGDDIRQIHWKLSSKLDELILKEASQPESRSLLVFWDKRTGGTPQQMDALAEVVSSAGMALLQSGVPYTLCWTDRDDLQTQDISEENQLLQAIPALVKTGGSADCRLPKTDGYSRILYFGTAPEEQLLTDGRVHCILCTEEQYPGATTFAPQNYSEAMQRLEV